MEEKTVFLRGRNQKRHQMYKGITPTKMWLLTSDCRGWIQVLPLTSYTVSHQLLISLCLNSSHMKWDNARSPTHGYEGLNEYLVCAQGVLAHTKYWVNARCYYYRLIENIAPMPLEDLFHSRAILHARRFLLASALSPCPITEQQCKRSDGITMSPTYLYLSAISRACRSLTSLWSGRSALLPINTISGFSQ